MRFIRTYFTPKFILQPIVENSIKYGLEKRKGLSIQILVNEFKNDQGKKDILFSVRDNGPGINEEKLAEISRKLKSDPMGERDSGFGILNVHARVMMMFGNQYELRVISSIDQGTEITIKIPAILKSEVSSYSRIQGDGDSK